jgi:hypothetical protein
VGSAESQLALRFRSPNSALRICHDPPRYLPGAPAA